MMDLIQTFKKTLSIVALSALLIISVQAIPVARAVDATFNVTLTVDSEIAINGTTTGTTTISNIALLPNIGISNDVASNSQNNVQIETTDADGYTLTLHATSSPAMQHDTTAATIANHNNGGTPAEWDTGAGNTEFGFGVFSSSGGSSGDIPNTFDDPSADGAATACLGLGSNEDPNFTNLDPEVGFAAAPTEGSAITIASNSSATSGPTDIDLCFYAEANADNPDAGSYTATIVLRAVAN